MIASIQEFGFKIPILVRSDGQVVDGHLRLKAAERLGCEGRRHVDTVSGAQAAVTDYTALAALGHVSRARLTQIMNLRNLAPDTAWPGRWVPE
jgi:ParB-like chromosome segregation protein Spo0J